MASCGGYDYPERVRRLKARKAKLRALGIIENSRKWNRLLYRGRW